MRFRGRSLYNSLQISAREEDALDVEPWQILDYRQVADSYLYQRLAALQISVTEQHFLLYAANSDGPEELLDCLWWQEEEGSSEQEEAYLLIFELWRRLLPTRRSVSIFFDDIDFAIAQFDEEEASSEELVELLFELEEILRQGREQGMDPQQVFSMLAEYAAQDVEQFLYDYILHVLEEEDGLLASTLIEMFEEYIPEKKWFDLLQVYLLVAFDSDKALSALCQILEEEKERSSADIPFLEEVFIFILCAEEVPLLTQGIGLLVECLYTEQDRKEFLEAILEDCSSLGLDSLQESLQDLVQGECILTKRLTEADHRALENFFLSRLLVL